MSGARQTGRPANGKLSRMTTPQVDPSDDFYTLLGVRADGVAPVVDLFPGDALALAEQRARALLAEHASCAAVEVWRGGALVGEIRR
jgi:hypothetical protein